MGTRSLTHIKDGNQIIATIYRQFDGYPSGMGADLTAFAGKLVIVNGYSPGQGYPTHANGMRCLAAALIAHLKTSDGKPDCGEEYTYTLYERDGRVFVTALGVYPDRVIFEGPLADFPCEDNG
jgi:hypothetical protein